MTWSRSGCWALCKPVPEAVGGDTPEQTRAYLQIAGSHRFCPKNVSPCLRFTDVPITDPFFHGGNY